MENTASRKIKQVPKDIVVLSGGLALTVDLARRSQPGRCS